MTKNQKTFAVIGAGVLLLLLFRKKKGAEKSLEGAPTEDSGMGGGGGGGFSPMPILPVIAPIVTTPATTPSPLVTMPNGTQVPLSNLSTSSVQSGTSTIANADTTANIGRATPTTTTTTTTTAIATKPPVASVSSAPTSAVKFTDFDGDPNFQDQLL
jgi:hypothetical protein